MITNLASDLKQTISNINGRASKNTPFNFYGREFPLKVTKEFLGTFKKSDELQVELGGPRLCFKWRNGSAHINSITEQQRLKKS